MHALHFREIIGRSWSAVPEGTSEVKEVELQESATIQGLAAKWEFQERPN